MQGEKHARIVVLPDGRDYCEESADPRRGAHRRRRIVRRDPLREIRREERRRCDERPCPQSRDRRGERVAEEGKWSELLAEQRAAHWSRAEEKRDPEDWERPERLVGEEQRERNDTDGRECGEPSSPLDEQFRKNRIVAAREDSSPGPPGGDRGRQCQSQRDKQREGDRRHVEKTNEPRET